jgi:hypothetical protein
MEIWESTDLTGGPELLEALELASLGENVDCGHLRSRIVTSRPGCQHEGVEHQEEPFAEPYEIEVLDGELVQQSWTLVRPEASERSLSWVSPPVQTAVAAATGFVAGAATLALLRRYGMSRLERSSGAGRGIEPLPPGRGHTYVVHVRPLRPPVE